jgi:hypothetical protein
MNNAIQKIVSSGILEKKRVFVTDKEYSRFLRPKKKQYDLKPSGLWYAVGSSWIDWCIGAEFNGLGKYIYEIELNKKANILLIDTKDKIFEFGNKYKNTKYPYAKFNSTIIDWERVKEDYDGIEVSPYFYDLRLAYDLLWYYGWDVPSGCLWKANTKKKITLIAEYDNYKDRFVLV